MELVVKPKDGTQHPVRILDLIAPRQRLLLWLFGPEDLRKVILWFADHPTAYRLRGVARVGIGIWLALTNYLKTLVWSGIIFAIPAKKRCRYAPKLDPTEAACHYMESTR